MKTFFGIIAVSVIVSLSLSWTFRYHIVVGNQALTVYSIDRWTGEVSLIAPTPTVRSITSQSLQFVHTPLVGLRGPSYQVESLSINTDSSD